MCSGTTILYTSIGPRTIDLYFCCRCCSSAALYRQQETHLWWKGICYAKQCSVSTMGLPASSWPHIYRPILVSGFHISRCCKLLPLVVCGQYSVVFHDISWSALGLLRLQDHLLGYANECIVYQWWSVLLYIGHDTDPQILEKKVSSEVANSQIIFHVPTYL